MNPGSSQFASQFPDAEETMSKMESKKLREILVEAAEILANNPEAYIVVNDDGYAPAVTLAWVEENAETGDRVEILSGGDELAPKVHAAWRV